MSQYEKIIDLLSRLGDDELRVIERFAARLLMGQERYGRLSLATDKRDWKAESSEELVDFLVYLTAREVSENGRPIEVAQLKLL